MTHNRTSVLFDKQARDKLKSGLDTAARAVVSTMGPRGKNVLIQKGDGMVPLVTKDGVTVSKSISLRDPVERMGADLIKEAASRTNDVAGDGTTTATALTHSLVSEGLKLMAAGYPGVDLKKGLDRGFRAVAEKLKELAVPVKDTEDIVRVGTISANGDRHIGEMIGSAMGAVGLDGVITVEEATGMTTTMSVAEGMQFDRGYVSPHFATNAEKMNAVYTDVLVLMTDKKLSDLQDIVPILEKTQRSGKALLIIAEEVEGSALHGLIINKMHSQLKVVAIRAPGFGTLRDNFLDDISVLTGGKIVSDKFGTSFKTLSLDDLGKAKKVTVDGKTTVIVGTGATKENVEARVAGLKAQMEDASTSEEDAKVLKQRIAKLGAGVAVIKVGGPTEVEMKEKKDRIIDALAATAAAVEEGVLPGGGIALLRCKQVLKDMILIEQNQSIRAGLQAIAKSCEAPLRCIIQNAGGSQDVAIAALEGRGPTVGWDMSNDKVVDMIESGIIDPHKVTRTALENAVSVAGTFLTLDAVVVFEEDESEE